MSRSAAAATAAHQQRNHVKKSDRKQTSGKEWPVSFHLQLHSAVESVKHEGMNSVKFLRLPLKCPPEAAAEPKMVKASLKAAGSKFEVVTKKYVRAAAGQDNAVHLVTGLLIATDRRLFIVSNSIVRKGDKITQPGSDFNSEPLESLESDSLEIVDSIPLEEVDSICIGGGDNKEWDHSLPDKKDGCLTRFLNELFPMPNVAAVEYEGSHETEQQIEEKLEKLMSGSGRELYTDYEGFLKISTVKKKHGFNGGRPFYFMVKNNSYRSLKRMSVALDSNKKSGALQTVLSRVSRKDSAGNKNETDLERVLRELQTLTTSRQLAFKRLHRFRRLQGKLQEIWDSVPFNVCLLFLIVSNFVFTVQQLENKDPSMQSYFERIDLVYTIFFCFGIASRFPVNFSSILSLLHTLKKPNWQASIVT
jgi:hypothetical protein